MAESITVEFKGREDGGQEVGIHYRPATSEFEQHDEMLAREVALHTLATQAIQLRQEAGMPIPEALVIVAQAYTFHDFFQP